MSFSRTALGLVFAGISLAALGLLAVIIWNPRTAAVVPSGAAPESVPTALPGESPNTSVTPSTKPTETLQTKEVPHVSKATNGQPEGLGGFTMVMGADIREENDTISLEPRFVPAGRFGSERHADSEILGSSSQPITVHHLDQTGGMIATTSLALLRCPSATDVCERDTEGLQVRTDELSVLSDQVYVSAGVHAFEFYYESTLLKRLDAPDSRGAPLLQNVTGAWSTELGQAIVTWEVAQPEQLPVFTAINYQNRAGNWRNLGIPSVTQGMVQFDPSRLAQLTNPLPLRIAATNGFWLEEYELSIDLPADQLVAGQLDVVVTGMPSEDRIVGQDMFMRLSFVDPDTKVGCDGEGCDNQAANYNITWSSNQQTICESDIHNGVLQYRFKRPGEHTITVSVAHPTIEAYQWQQEYQIRVNESPWSDGETYQEGDCSYF